MKNEERWLKDRLLQLEKIMHENKYPDFDGPCWCNKRNTGVYEKYGHNRFCKALKEYFNDPPKNKVP